MRLADFLNASPVSVNFVRAADIEIDFCDLELEVMQGSLAHLRVDCDLFNVVACAMKFPFYFGTNWDALDECMRDMEWLPADGYLLILYDSDRAWSKHPYALGRFVTSWLEASEYWGREGKSFRLLFVM